MEKEIVILADRDGNITSAVKAEKIIKYAKCDGIWKETQRMRINSLESGALKPEENAGEQLSGIRSYFDELITSLGSCQILAGTQVSGILYKLLSSKDYVIIETDLFTEDMLDDIYEKALKADEPLQAIALPTKPQEIAPGEYFFNFKALKARYKAITSKETIKQFLEKQRFEKLTIICNHKMPWLDEDLKRLGLVCEETRKDSDVVLTIKPQNQMEATWENTVLS